MSIPIVPRKEVRAKLAELIAAKVSTAVAVLAYAPKTIASATATVCVTSGGSDHALVLETTNDHAYEFDVWMYVPRAGTGAIEEDALDELERLVSLTIEDNPVLDPYWTDLALRDKTQATYMMIGGMQYRAELVPLKVQPQRTGPAFWTVALSIIGGLDVIA
jgi:hypothetical protein